MQVVVVPLQLIQLVMPHGLAMQVPARPSFVVGLNVCPVTQPHAVLLFISEAPEGHTQLPFDPRIKVGAHSEQLLLPEQATQLETLQIKHWFRSLLRVKPDWQP